MTKKQLKSIIEDYNTPWGRRFDYFIQSLILISLISFALETLQGLPPKIYIALTLAEKLTVIIFSIEFVLRVWVANKPIRYIFSFYGIIDLLAILPFYVIPIYDFRAIRAFRIFRVFRALKLIRYSKALRRFHIAFSIIKEELILFFITTAIFIYLTAAGIYYFEHEVQPDSFQSIFHSLWWAIVTLTTVGYGDVYPITLGGKVFTFFVLIIGVGIVTVPAGLVASSLSKAREIQDRETDEETRELS
nr:ion transporter [uncultured Carboxylicivirga sp.]